MSSPPRKKEKKEEVVGVSSDDPLSGFIRFEVDVNEIEGGKRIITPVIEVMGMPWKIRTYKLSSSSFLELYLVHRHSVCDLWSVDVSLEVRVINSNTGKSLIKKASNTYDYKIESYGFYQIINWSDAINEEKGFIKDGKITLEARFTLSNIKGIRTDPRFDFTVPNEPFHDVALLIEGEKVYVSKQILAVHSPVFNAMFYGNFDEKNKNEIELKDIHRKEFIEMLEVIYPSRKKVTDANAEFLMALGDRFQIKIIIDQVEQFFIESTKMGIVPKLKLSDRYRLVKLQEHCLESLKTIKDIQDLKTTDGYDDLSNNVKANILEKVMRIRP